MESGPFEGKFGRVFHVTWEADRLALRGTAPLPQPVENVEGTAVVRSGERLLLLWAERGEGADSTSLRWAELALDPLRLGEVETATVAVPEPRDPARRQITALEADGEGRLWAASTSAPGDRGPFRSFVWEIGKVGAAGVEVAPPPRQVAVVDGFKIEAPGRLRPGRRRPDRSSWAPMTRRWAARCASSRPPDLRGSSDRLTALLKFWS